MGAGRAFQGIAAVIAGLLSPAAAEAGIDLQRASVEHLSNGLTLIMLQDRSFPVVSVQALYKSGARDETAGKTGIAHFLEHLAFRASQNFPNAGGTEAIYDAGGEWHGYTWIDQTTYFSTIPRDGLDLLLRIEADRMARVTIDPAAIAAEKGAVLTELHGYENDPDSVLLDTLLAHALLVHPYRNNTIGSERDVAALTIDDARAFYDRHYKPGNAVIAIVGDFDPREVRALVGRHFDGLDTRPLPARSEAVEPPQTGQRRVTLTGQVDGPRLAMAFPAPAASNRDFPAFLVLQQLLSGGSGINFRENDWGTAAVEGSMLSGAARDLSSWFIATTDPYVFVIKGKAGEATESQVEAEIAERIFTFRLPPEQRLRAAKVAVQRQLAADVQSTEDAAHQLAYFEGIGALDQLRALPKLVERVRATDVARVAATYLTPAQQTIAWMVPGQRVGPRPGVGAPKPSQPTEGTAGGTTSAPGPRLFRLAGGLPVLVQPNPFADDILVELVTSVPVIGERSRRELGGLGSVVRTATTAGLPALLSEVRATLMRPAGAIATTSTDPSIRLQQLIERQTGIAAGVPAPVALVIAGAIPEHGALENALGALADVKPAVQKPSAASAAPIPTIREAIARPLSQGAMGYVARVPSPSTRQGLAARLVLYILTHDYSGRLGRSAIRDKGLTYHIYSALRSNGADSHATIWTGVDPDHADALEAEFRAQVSGLIARPPTNAEIHAAKQHLLGRHLSAAQRNDELAASLAQQYVFTGGIVTYEKLAEALGEVTGSDLVAAAQSLASGTLIRVDVGQ